MHPYTAKSTDTKVFSLTQNDVFVGELTYESWFSFTSAIRLHDGSVLDVRPKGFWGTTIEVKDGENVVLDFKMNWKGEILLHTYFTDTGDYFVLAQRGMFKVTFVLLRNDEELLVVEPDFKWNRLAYDYRLTATDAFEKLPAKELMLLTAVHGANYFITMMTTASMGGA